MKKAAIQLGISLLLFAAIWFALSRFDFVGDATTETIGRDTENKLGDLLLKQLDMKYPRSGNDSLRVVIDQIHRRICEANDIDADSISIHVYQSSVINAAVLPGSNIIIFTGLLDATENAEEFAGVHAHELGHITKNHVSERMLAEFGTTLLLMMSGMDAGSEVLSNLLRILTTTAFSRDQEREADQKAVEYLTAAEIDAVHLGNFLLRISTRESGKRAPEWISTHPDSRNRAAEIFDQREKTRERVTSDDNHFETLYPDDWSELMDLQ
ncbi:MAG: M48 family metallopeptidase [Cyclonatronaceae bacterium]